MSRGGVNWVGIESMSRGGVNWVGVDALSRSGVNWVGVVMMRIMFVFIILMMVMFRADEVFYYKKYFPEPALEPYPDRSF